MVTRLVTLRQAKLHLHILDNRQDEDLLMKIEQASGTVLKFKKLNAVPAEWFTGSPLVIDAPQDVQLLTLHCLAEIFYNREAGNVNLLSESMKALLDRPPTLA